MTVADKQTGAYIEGNSILTGIKTIQLGKNSSGLFIKMLILLLKQKNYKPKRRS